MRFFMLGGRVNMSMEEKERHPRHVKKSKDLR